MQAVEWKFGEAFGDGAIVRFSVGTKTYGELWATVDASDWPRICHLKWRATRRKHLFYVRDGSGDILLHRFLIDAADGLVVDHRDGDGLHNRRANIRECTQGENVTFAHDRKRGHALEIIREEIPTKPHVVRARLADGTFKEYVYKSRAKSGTKTAVVVKRGADYKTRNESLC